MMWCLYVLVCSCRTRAPATLSMRNRPTLAVQFGLSPRQQPIPCKACRESSSTPPRLASPAAAHWLPDEQIHHVAATKSDGLGRLGRILGMEGATLYERRKEHNGPPARPPCRPPLLVPPAQRGVAARGLAIASFGRSP